MSHTTGLEQHCDATSKPQATGSASIATAPSRPPVRSSTNSSAASIKLQERATATRDIASSREFYRWPLETFGAFRIFESLLQGSLPFILNAARPALVEQILVDYTVPLLRSLRFNPSDYPARPVQ